MCTDVGRGRKEHTQTVIFLMTGHFLQAGHNRVTH